MNLPCNFIFKYPKTAIELSQIKPALLEVLVELIRYCEGHDIDLVITRILGEKIPGVSVSNSHAEGRAMDIRTRHLTKQQVGLMVAYFNTKYYNIAAISLKTGEPTLMVDHYGTEQHIHVQVHPNSK